MATVDAVPNTRFRTERSHTHRLAPPLIRVASVGSTDRIPVVLPLSVEGSLPGIALRHSGVGTFCDHVADHSIFLHPLAPRALPRFIATMGALTPAGRPARIVWKTRQVSLLHALNLPTVPSPTTRCRLRRGVCLLLQSSGLRLGLAGSPRHLAESSSSLSYGPVVRLRLLPTPPRDGCSYLRLQCPDRH